MKADIEAARVRTALRSSTARRILRYLDRQPIRSEKTIASALEIHPKVVAYHVHRLNLAGLVGWYQVGELQVCQATSKAEPFLAGMRGASRSPRAAIQDEIQPADQAAASNRPFESHMLERMRQRFRVPG